MEVPDKPLPPIAVDELPTDLFPIPNNEESGVSASSVPMQLFESGRTGEDFLLLCLKAKVEGNCITLSHYRIVVKLFLFEMMLQYLIEAVPRPEAIARLLRRLSRESKSVPSFESDDQFDTFLDPNAYDGYLAEMLSDMEEYIKSPEPSLPDGYVYVRRGTDTHAQFLLATASALNTVSSS